jgi:hypothetical protein
MPINSQSLAIFPQRLPWRAIADEIKEAGLPYNRQASALGKNWSTFQRWLDGAEPRHSDGEALLLLHRQVCGRTALTQNGQTPPDE